ncbi:MAG: diacylglycerol kinase family protein [Candidatus Fonsibacter sp.]|nr:diacylglycerol kinase family protein [Candidatus Fonsibacter sp.]
MLKFITDRIKSFGPAWKGLFWLFKNEGNAQFHLIATIVVVIAGFYLKVTIFEWVLLCFAIGLVISAEALNTAIEKAIDLLHPQKHEKAGLVKDLAAAGVLITSITAVIIAALVFIPKVW